MPPIFPKLSKNSKINKDYVNEKDWNNHDILIQRKSRQESPYSLKLFNSKRSPPVSLESAPTAIDTDIASVGKLDVFYSDFYNSLLRINHPSSNKSMKFENLKVPKKSNVVKLKSTKHIGSLSPLLLVTHKFEFWIV